MVRQLYNDEVYYARAKSFRWSRWLTYMALVAFGLPALIVASLYFVYWSGQ